MSSILPFFDEPGNKGRERVPVQAIPKTVWGCGRCGANLLTTGGRDHGKGVKYAKVVNGEVQCSNCGAVNSLQPVNWSGKTP